MKGLRLCLLRRYFCTGGSGNKGLTAALSTSMTEPYPGRLHAFRPPSKGGAVTTTDLFFTPATELDRLIRMRAISPLELPRSLLERIERLNPKLNAFLTVTADLALAHAKAAGERAMRGARGGPMEGSPYS